MDVHVGGIFLEVREPRHYIRTFVHLNNNVCVFISINMCVCVFRCASRETYGGPKTEIACLIYRRLQSKFYLRISEPRIFFGGGPVSK